MPEPTPFSVLLPVYAGDDAVHFARSVASVTHEQSLRPSELVIVVDGPVPAAIASVLDRVGDGTATGVPTRIIALPRNVGLAGALEAGLDACAHEVIARADADDVSLPERFAVQVPLVAGGVDLLGSAITEFEDDESAHGLTRRLPSDPDEIAAMARFRDPFNHPSVVYRRSAVRAAGGYEHVDKMEDYWLFARMIASGARVQNVPESLVLYRVGAGAYGRRGGHGMLRSELGLQARFLRSGFTTPAQGVRNVLVRGVYRYVPAPIRRWAYRAMVSGRSANTARVAPR